MNTPQQLLRSIFFCFFLLCKIRCSFVSPSRKTQSFTLVNSFVFLSASSLRWILLRRRIFRMAVTAFLGTLLKKCSKPPKTSTGKEIHFFLFPFWSFLAETPWYRDFIIAVRLDKIGYRRSKNCVNDITYRLLVFRFFSKKEQNL